MKITGAQAIILSLLQEKVEVIFGYPGGAIIPTYDALYDVQDQIHHVLVLHEQGAAHAAEGYARASQISGCMLSNVRARCDEPGDRDSRCHDGFCSYCMYYGAS